MKFETICEWRPDTRITCQFPLQKTLFFIQKTSFSPLDLGCGGSPRGLFCSLVFPALFLDGRGLPLHPSMHRQISHPISYSWTYELRGDPREKPQLDRGSFFLQKDSPQKCFPFFLFFVFWASRDELWTKAFSRGYPVRRCPGWNRGAFEEDSAGSQSERQPKAGSLHAAPHRLCQG